MEAEGLEVRLGEKKHMKGHRLTGDGQEDTRRNDGAEETRDEEENRHDPGKQKEEARNRKEYNGGLPLAGRDVFKVACVRARFLGV